MTKSLRIKNLKFLLMEQIKKFAEGFFKNLKCKVRWESQVVGCRLQVAEEKGTRDVLIVENVPRSFEDLFGKGAPYYLSFSNSGGRRSEVGGRNVEFVEKGSQMLVAMVKYLEGAGKATLLKIDFDVDAEAEIRKRVGLKNCEIASSSDMTLVVPSLSKSTRNSFFSRFSFVTSFNFLNESERVLSEVYVHNGEVVDGDLDGYTVVDGEQLSIDGEKVKKDYVIAKAKVVELTKGKQKEIAGVLKEKVEAEISRIGEHYDRQLKELGGDLNGKLEKIRKVELELRSCEEEERDELRKRLERLRGGLIKAGDDDVAERVLREKEMTIRDVMYKYSLNVNRKLVNITVIYYPCYIFKLCLKNSKVAGRRSQVADRVLEVEYDPLTKSFSGLDCEGCFKKLSRINLCRGGHICCEDCLDKCGECGGVFCSKCLKRSCKVCGRKLCKGCVKVCLICGGSVCATHFRKDCVSGEDRCVSCLRACLRCHGMCEERFFGEAMDGSKVCGKCLGVERSGKVLGRVFGG